MYGLLLFRIERLFSMKKVSITCVFFEEVIDNFCFLKKRKGYLSIEKLSKTFDFHGNQTYQKYR